MKLGVFTTLLSNKSFDESLKYLSSKGVKAIEIGAGGYPGTAHADPKKLLTDENAFKTFMATIKKYDMTVSGISAHGNPIHPNQEIADDFDEQLTNAILLAEKMGVEVVNTFSGCPGDSETSQKPNWVVCPWPNDFSEILEYQWKDVLIPYWRKKAKFAKEHNVVKIALEMHPGFCVYNPETAIRLRESVGNIIGVNFDPSHLIWQGIDPILAIKVLGQMDMIYHFHAKDTKVDKYNTALNGVLDTKSYAREIDRSWVFRSCGYGNDYGYWKDIVSVLKMVSYDNAISIEHEDSLMSVDEGLTKTIDFLNEILITQDADDPWWI